MALKHRQPRHHSNQDPQRLPSLNTPRSGCGTPITTGRSGYSSGAPDKNLQSAQILGNADDLEARAQSKGGTERK